MLNILHVDEIKGFNRISETIAKASIEKGFEN